MCRRTSYVICRRRNAPFLPVRSHPTSYRRTSYVISRRRNAPFLPVRSHSTSYRPTSYVISRRRNAPFLSVPSHPMSCTIISFVLESCLFGDTPGILPGSTQTCTQFLGSAATSYHCYTDDRREQCCASCDVHRQNYAHIPS